MIQQKQTPKPDHMFFRKFISYLAITVPIGLIPEFIRQDFHLDLLSWQKGGRLTLIMFGVAAAMAGIDWLVHRYRTKRQQQRARLGQTGKGRSGYQRYGSPTPSGEHAS
ncbi:hypothetical protein OKS68_01305 [Aeromonas veronii]|uniref:hypothetical protein n=1 Tax=Aeromonas veronii TaxID=654 RepID=UPI00226C8E3F|nr:hypothetical protein [Aeromonas veronii]MCX9131109.1 hypothetical protein [Aeromonas veronii]